MEEESGDLLFELSSDDRLSILKEIERGPKNLIKISNNTGLTAQGTSRNIARLVQKSIISKNSNGEYELTPYGNTALKLLASYRFLSNNRRYFQTHETSILPYYFINRLGELEASSYQGDFITTFAIAERMMNAAERYVYAMEEQMHPNAPPIVAEQLKRGVLFRTILPESIVPPPGFRPATGVERRLLPEVKVNLFLTDKGAIFGFPTSERRIDYGVFIGEDERFHKWCLDLFNHYWALGKDLQGQVPNLS